MSSSTLRVNIIELIYTKSISKTLLTFEIVFWLAEAFYIDIPLVI